MNTFSIKTVVVGSFLKIIATIFVVTIICTYVQNRFSALKIRFNQKQTRGEIIIKPLNNEIIQQHDGSAEITLLIKEEAVCTLDGRLVGQRERTVARIGKHLLRCTHETTLESIDFYVGDVFIVMGQSNSIGASKNISLSPVPVSETIWFDPYKRLFRAPGIDEENISRGIEIGGNMWISFMNKYKTLTSYPVGVVNLTRVATIDRYLQGELNPTAGDYYYNFIIDEIQKYDKPSGIILFHGESATKTLFEAQSYPGQLRKLIESVRNNLRYDLNFFIINIGRNITLDVPKEELDNWNVVRKGIYEVTSSVSGVYLVGDAASYSLNCEEISGDSDCLHLGQKGLNSLGESTAKNIFHIVYETKTE